MCGRTRGSAWRCEKTNSSPGLKTLCIRSVDLELVYGGPHLGAAPPSGARLWGLRGSVAILCELFLLFLFRLDRWCQIAIFRPPNRSKLVSYCSELIN